jgi:glycosyltransferase involved in cell wall biosynthesis
VYTNGFPAVSDGASAMDNLPLVSVVIPTYRRESLIACAIRSVQNQTYPNIEIIVVDDSSPDRTEEVVRRIVDPRIRYIRHERNHGLAAAGRNTGIRAAHGEYIAFLDDDDEWLETIVEKQLKAIEGHDAVLCAALINGTRIKRHKRPIVTQRDLRKGCEFDPSSLMARASVLRDLFFDEQLREGEDWDVFIRIAQKHSIAYVNEPLLIYNDGGHERITNEAKNLSAKGLQRRTAVLHKHREFFGSFWFRYHMADALLSYFWYRRGKLKQVAYAIGRCGIVAVAAVFVDKIIRMVRRRIEVA